MDSSNSRGPGRPSRNEQLDLENRLRPFFDSMLSAKLAAEKTGISIKTAEKYFKIWADQLRENHSENIVERQKNSKVKLLNALDHINFNLLAQHNRITRAILDHEKNYSQNKYTKDGKPKPYLPDLVLEQKLSEVIKMQQQLYDTIANIEASPTIDEQTEKEMIKRFQEKAVN